MKLVSMLTTLLIATFVVSLALPFVAQAKDQAIDMANARASIRAQKLAVVKANMEFTESEEKAFWPLYKEYGEQKGELWNRRIDVIKIFLGAYEDMSPEMSRILLDQSFNIDKQMLELKMKYAEKFDDILPPNKVTRLFQAENKLSTTMQMEIVKDVPLAK